jgi:hypothetical protein
MGEQDIGLQARLDEALLLAGRVEGDRLLLADATMLAAIGGERALSANERAALCASPLTLRRFRTLALARRRERAVDAWRGSPGMLRAAADGQPLSALATDDGHWRLHFLQQDGAWRVILALDAHAPFAVRLLREQALLRVVDGGGAIVMHGRLDADGECESAWPFDSAPAAHFQHCGAGFAVEPVHP